MKKYEITEEQTQQVINYLATCPYGQVFQLVQFLMTLTEIKDDKTNNI
jgi:hypothetical protein